MSFQATGLNGGATAAAGKAIAAGVTFAANAASAGGSPATSGQRFILSPTTLKDKIEYFKELVFAYMIVVDKSLNDQVSIIL